jgi:hypothetical protein
MCEPEYPPICDDASHDLKWNRARFVIFLEVDR